MRKSLKSKLIILSTLTLTGLGISINQRIDDVHAAEGDAYALVTDASSLAIGDTIIIAATDYNYALSTTQNTNNRKNLAITKSGNEISYVTGLQDIVLEAGSVEGTFAFNVSTGYLYAASSSANHLKTKTSIDDNASWTIEIADAGVATIKAQGTYTRNWMRYNNSSSLFSCYASGQQDISIYKMQSDTTTYETTFMMNDGTDTVYHTALTADGSGVQFPADPIRDGYSFLGWYDAATGGDQVPTLTATANSTLYAHWAVKVYVNIIFDYNYEGAPEDYVARTGIGDLVVFPETPTREGYAFLGWFDAQSGGNKIDSVLVESALTLYAQWEESILTKVTSINQVKTGNYTISSVYQDVEHWIASHTGSYYSQSTAQADLITFRFEQQEDSSFTIQDLSNNKYLYWSSGNNLPISETLGTTDNYKWIVAVDATGQVTITNKADSTRLIQYNRNNPRFACYASAQTAISLYAVGGGDTTSPISEKHTVASLGFTYSVEQEVYSFSNVRIRFKSSLEEETYNTLDITGAGVEITAEGYSDVMDIDCSSSIGTETIDGVSYRYIIGTISNIPTTEFTTALTAKGYFVVDGEKVYLQECTYSVVTIANRTLEETLTTEQENALLAFMIEYGLN